MGKNSAPLQALGRKGELDDRCESLGQWVGATKYEWLFHGFGASLVGVHNSP